MSNLLISVNHLDKATALKNQLVEAGLNNVSFQPAAFYSPELGDFVFGLEAFFNEGLTSFVQLAQASRIVATPMDLACCTGTGTNSEEVGVSQFITTLYDSVKDTNVGMTNPVIASDYRLPDTTIKFYPFTAFEKYEPETIWLVNPPYETQKDGRTYRLAFENPLCSVAGRLSFCRDDRSPLFNYLDKGNILVFHPKERLQHPLVTDRLSLDTCSIIAAWLVAPEAVLPHLQAGVFLPAASSRNLLLKVEKGIPKNKQEEYQALKSAVSVEFRTSSTDVLLGKFIREEVDYVDINGIRITKDKAVFESISLEYKGLFDIVFNKLDPSEQWDIYTILSLFAQDVQKQFDVVAAAVSTKKVEFKINDIPISVSLGTTNKSTRRVVNTYGINKDELAAVIQRASCFNDKEQSASARLKDYNFFLRDVSLLSLYATNIVTAGMPVNTIVREQIYGQEAKDKGPKTSKLMFKRNGTNKFSLITPHGERPITKFVSMLHALAADNKKFANSMDVYRNENGGFRTGQTPMDRLKERTTSLLDTLAKYVSLTDEDKTSLVQSINKEAEEAFAKSEKLLQAVVEQTNAKYGVREGSKGYEVLGTLRTYFIEEDSLKVYNADPDAQKKGDKTYFCVIPGKAEQGFGRDALAARILSMYNDSTTQNFINTLAKPAEATTVGRPS
jgi:hypothetical protein